MYAEFNNNPKNKRVGDCVIRAIAKALGKEWNEVYIDLSMEGYRQSDSFQSMAVWGHYLSGPEYAGAVCSRSVLPETSAGLYRG